MKYNVFNIKQLRNWFLTDFLPTISKKIKKLSFQKKIFLAISLLLFIIYLFLLPKNLFTEPYSTVIEDNNGVLLGAHISKDGQWRFPETDSVPYKFEQSLVTFEDKRFFYHFGIDLIAVARSTWLNVKYMGVVSGASTISMQVIRLSRKNRNRSLWEKVIEMIYATRLELKYSKREILALYASHAPFGGNVVGIEAAAWRYFGRKPHELSWAESALLAVLPNSPALIHPGRNREELRVKRNKLLKQLFEKEIIDEETYELAVEEPIPDEPDDFPQLAPHLLMYFHAQNNNSAKIKTTIQADIQSNLNEILYRHYLELSENEINNLAALIIDVETGNVIAYTGNVWGENIQNNNCQVDVIRANRSTGSILKPFLYAAMLSDGQLLPNALVPDIPTIMGDFAPQNYNRGYDGAVPAHRAIARSLNVPAVRLLMKYSVAKFHYLLKRLGMSSITKPPDYYGLSLILGGCEGSLWEIASVYAGMARSLNNFNNYGFTNENDYFEPFLVKGANDYAPEEKMGNNPILSPAALWFTFEAMLEVERPEDEANWQSFSSSQKIAWKTGTSFGFRDAWAIGLNKKYVVAVWVGNANGVGRPDLVGVKAAAPVLFDIFDFLPSVNNWFKEPLNDMIEATVCSKSGFLASTNCEFTQEMLVPSTGSRFESCPYCQIIHLDKSEKFQVSSNCESPDNMIHKSWFVLPPAMEWYFKSRNATYTTLPPFKEGCNGNMENTTNNIEILYPTEGIQIFVPTELDETSGRTIFRAVHRNANSVLYWHIDNNFIGQTQQLHQVAVAPDKGWHTLSVVDESGERKTVKFLILDED